MARKTQLRVALLLLSVLVLCAGLALAKKDPELKQCKHQCKVQQQFDEKQKEECRKKCEEYYKEKKQREREQGGGRESEEEEEEDEEEWGGSSSDEPKPGEPEEHLKECQRQCDRQEGEQQTRLCRFRCQDKYRREKDGGEAAVYNNHIKEREQEEEENPYVFEQKHFISTVRTEHGSVYVLPKFTQRSKLLRGLENYRLGVLVVNPQSFVLPHHFDADVVFLVAWGRGAITTIRENNRESFSVERGHIIKVPAGTPLYLVNKDDNEKLYIVKFIRTINLPGQYEVYHGAGGFNPDSFFRAFSYEILEAAFKSTKEKVDRLFSQQGQGIIVKATKQQIQALGQGGGGPSIWPFAAESGSLFNLFRKPPTQSNNYGQLFEVDSNDFSALQDLDMAVSYANITKGAMSAPLYNSRSTTVAIVISGDGHMEIACPHISASSEGGHHRGHHKASKKSQPEKGGTTFHQVRSRIKDDTVVVIPAGHPFVTMASKNSNLEIACFEINAQGNIKYPLAGRRNVINLMEREAKELAFRTRSEEVDQMFGTQDEDFFFPGPAGPHEEGRAYE